MLKSSYNAQKDKGEYSSDLDGIRKYLCIKSSFTGTKSPDDQCND